jgi:hypothetical protein
MAWKRRKSSTVYGFLAPVFRLFLGKTAHLPVKNRCYATAFIDVYATYVIFDGIILYF